MARYVLILLLLVATGCEKLREGVVRDIQFPEHEPLLAITTRIGEGDPAVIATVYQSASVLDPEGSVPATDAVVTVSWGGAVRWSWSGSDGMLEAVLTEPWSWETGQEVVLEGEAPGLPSVVAREIVPPSAEGAAVALIGADTVLTPWIEEPMVQDFVQVDVVNHEGVDDWYLIQVEEYSELGGSVWFPLWAEPDLATGERLEFNFIAQGFLISDLGLDQTPFNNFTFINTRFPEDLVPTQRVRITSLSEALYRHYVSLAANAASAGNPFAEPASVFGNMDGGFGVMGLTRELILPL